MSGIVFALPGNEEIAGKIARERSMENGQLELRQFPDGEHYVRILTSPKGKQTIIVSSLDQPDGKVLPLIFAAGALRKLGATEIGLVSPYLGYMRQDKRFNPGESITSVHFAHTLDQWFDWLVTIDPHLHRYKFLSEIYSIPAKAVHAAPLLSTWLKKNVQNPLVVGPDGESEQWVGAVALDAAAHFIVLNKTRKGDRDVEVSVPQIDKWKNCTPVLIDDIISTARTMIETVQHLKAVNLPAPICIGIHAVFAQNAYTDLKFAGAGRIVTSNTITHDSNQIDVSGLLAAGISDVTPT